MSEGTIHKVVRRVEGCILGGWEEIVCTRMEVKVSD